MTPIIVAAVVFLQFHGPGGHRIDLNRDAISSIRDPTALPEGHFGKGTNCLILIDGAPPIAVIETCDEVRHEVNGRTGPCTLVCGEAPKR